MNHQSIDECLVLSTCNRLEIFAVSNLAHPINEIHLFICSHPSLANTSFPSLISLKRKRMPSSIPLSYPSQMIDDGDPRPNETGLYKSKAELVLETLIRLFERVFKRKINSCPNRYLPWASQYRYCRTQSRKSNLWQTREVNFISRKW